MKTISAWVSEDRFFSQEQAQWQDNDQIRQWLVDAYQDYLLEQKAKKQYFAAHAQISGYEPYDLVIVDELQAFSFGQINELMRLARGHRLLALFDTNQVLINPISVRNYIKTRYKQQHGRNVAEKKLPETYRYPQAVAVLVNELQVVRNALYGGKSDKEESFQQASLVREGQLFWHDDPSDAVLRSQLQTRMERPGTLIITEACFIDEAKAIFGTKLVFTPESVAGLEGECVIIYKLFSSSIFEAINHKLLKMEPIKQVQHLPKKAHESSDYDYALALNRFFIALTRSTKQVIVVQEPAALLALLKNLPSLEASHHSRQPLLDYQSEQSWETFIQNLCQHELYIQARNQMQKLGWSQEKIASFLPKDSQDCPAEKEVLVNEAKKVGKKKKKKTKAKGKMPSLESQTIASQDLIKPDKITQDKMLRLLGNFQRYWPIYLNEIRTDKKKLKDFLSMAYEGRPFIAALLDNPDKTITDYLINQMSYPLEQRQVITELLIDPREQIPFLRLRERGIIHYGGKGISPFMQEILQKFESGEISWSSEMLVAMLPKNSPELKKFFELQEKRQDTTIPDVFFSVHDDMLLLEKFASECLEQGKPDPALLAAFFIKYHAYEAQIFSSTYFFNLLQKYPEMMFSAAKPSLFFYLVQEKRYDNLVNFFEKIPALKSHMIVKHYLQSMGNSTLYDVMTEDARTNTYASKLEEIITGPSLRVQSLLSAPLTTLSLDPSYANVRCNKLNYGKFGLLERYKMATGFIARAREKGNYYFSELVKEIESMLNHCFSEHQHLNSKIALILYFMALLPERLQIELNNAIQDETTTSFDLSPYKPLNSRELGCFIQVLRMTQITTLYMNALEISDEILSKLLTVPGLKTLDLSHNKITDRGMASLFAYEGLEKLLLAHNHLTDTTGRIFSRGEKKTRIKALNLAGNKLGDNALKYLRELHHLEILDLSDNQITNNGVVHLMFIPNLMVLNLSRNIKINSEAKFTFTGTQLERLELEETGLRSDEIKAIKALVESDELIKSSINRFSGILVDKQKALLDEVDKPVASVSDFLALSRALVEICSGAQLNFMKLAAKINRLEERLFHRFANEILSKPYMGYMRFFVLASGLLPEELKKRFSNSVLTGIQIEDLDVSGYPLKAFQLYALAYCLSYVPVGHVHLGLRDVDARLYSVLSRVPAIDPMDLNCVNPEQSQRFFAASASSQSEQRSASDDSQFRPGGV